MIMNVITKDVKDEPPWCLLFVDDIELCQISKFEVEERLEKWRKAMEDIGLKISRKKTEYLPFKTDYSIGCLPTD